MSYTNTTKTRVTYGNSPGMQVNPSFKVQNSHQACQLPQATDVFVVCLCDIFRALIDSLVCRFCTGTLGLVLFRIMFLFVCWIWEGKLLWINAVVALLLQVQGADAAGDFHRQGPWLGDVARFHHRRARSDGRPLLFHVQPLPQGGILGITGLVCSVRRWLMVIVCSFSHMTDGHCVFVQSHDWWSLCVRSVRWLMVLVCPFSQEMTDGHGVSVQLEFDWWSWCVRSVGIWLMVMVCPFSWNMTDGHGVSIQSEDN